MAPRERCLPATRSGIVLAVRRGAILGWCDIARSGWSCLAGARHLSGGCPVRVVVVFLLTGASLPGFDSDPSKLAEEASLVQFVGEQLRLVDELGIPFSCMGDFNSAASLDLDIWHGSHFLRPSSLAADTPSFHCLSSWARRPLGLHLFCSLQAAWMVFGLSAHVGLSLSCCSTLRLLLAGVAVLIMSPRLLTFLPRSPKSGTQLSCRPSFLASFGRDH